jgi:hypothetical protein
MSSERCPHHSDMTATWECLGCAKLACFKCIEEGVTRHPPATCRDCGGRVVSVDLHRQASYDKGGSRG